ncbi:MAG: hypothetical protein OXR73_34680 [Myxococcales bacterium]|nr:hypothetical protein [Myxococcales bacterium]
MDRFPIALPLPLEQNRLVYRWDLDKTYLRTDFDTVRDLVSRAFERASEKHTVPGAAALLRELRGTDPAGIYILSGSPEQMRRVLEAKLRLDGIRWDGFVLKPSLRNLLKGQFGFLRDQVGFKLSALLSSRESLPAHVDEVLFGDDAETDAFNYALYADICAGRVDQDVLSRVLSASATTEEDMTRLLRLAGRLPKRECVARIFIHLDRMSSAGAFDAYGTRVCPFFNYLQPAVVLLEMGAISAASALRVAADLVIDQGFTQEALTASYLELARRGHVGGRPAELMGEALEHATNEYSTATPVLRAFGEELARASLRRDPPEIDMVELDYEAQLARERARARDAKRRVLGRLR